MIVRDYRPSDVDALIALFRASVREVARQDYTEAQVRAWAPDEIARERWVERCAANATFVAEIDGRIAGFADLAEDGLIDMLFVSPAHQRRGVAAALMGRIETLARARGLERLYSDVSRTARGFFERSGFGVLAEQQVERRGQVLVNFRMEKVLG